MKKRILQLFILCLLRFNPITASVGDFFEAEDFNSTEGCQAEENAALSGGGNVGYIQNGRWIKFTSVDFDGTEKRIDIAAAGAAGGNIEVRLGAADGTLIGNVAMEGTSGWSDYQIFSGDLVSTTGVQDLYLVFTGGSGYLFNLDYFIFDKYRYEAEDFVDTEGCQAESNGDLSGGANVGYIQNGLWIKFDSISFNGIQNRIEVSAAGTTGGNIEFRLDSVKGELAGTVNITGTSGWSDYQSFYTGIDLVGIHDLYLVFTGESGYLFNVDYFEFMDDVPDFTLTLVADPVEGGAITTNIPGPVYDSLTTVALTAENNAGYAFDYWKSGSGDSLTNINPYSVVLISDSTINAVFKTVPTFALDLTVDNGEFKITTPLDTVDEKFVYNEGTSVELFALPNIGYKFVGWEDNSGNELSSSNPYTLTLDSDTSVSAVIESLGIADPNDSLLAYYAFEENVVDGSGNRFDGTILGEPKFVNGKAGKALYFQDGDAVNTGIHFDPQGSFAVSFWFKVQQWDEKWGNVIIGDKGDNNADGENVGFQLRHYDAVPADGGGRLAFSTRGVETDKDGYSTDMRYNGPIYPNQWNHMVLVYSKESYKKQIYMNNTLVVDGNITNPENDFLPSAAYDKLFIGARNDETSTSDLPQASFNGVIDEVKIFTTSLDSEFINDLYNSYAIDLPEVAYWKFDSANVDSVFDELGYSNGLIQDTLVRTSGYWGGGITFDGVADTNYVIVPDNDSINMTDNSFSISALVKFDASTNPSGNEVNVLFKGGTGEATITAPYTGDTWQTYGNWFSLGFKGNELRFYIDDNENKTQIGVDVSKYFKGDWALLTAVRDVENDSLKLYANGILMGAVSDTTEDISTVDIPLIIGNNGVMDKAFPGQIDELKIIKKALTEAEVAYMATDYSLDEFPLNDDAGISTILVNDIPIPFFDMIKEYDIDIPESTSSITVKAIPSDTNASIDYIQDIDSCVIYITAEDGVTNDNYTLYFNYISSDATLSALTLSEGTLSPAFSSDVKSYQSSVNTDVSSVTVTATPTSDKAQVVGDGEITLTSGVENTINIVVTAEDGYTELTYTIVIDNTVNIENSILNNTLVYFSADKLIIRSDVEIQKAEVFNVSGNKVLSKLNIGTSGEIDLDNLPHSIYFVRVFDKDDNIRIYKLHK